MIIIPMSSASGCFLRPGLCLSVYDFLLWHSWQRLCQLLESQNSSRFPRCGMMWSTSVAGCPHIAQSGCRIIHAFRAFLHAKVYPRSLAEARSSSARRVNSARRAFSFSRTSAACWAQYEPSVAHCVHPACAQGRRGFRVAIIRWW